MLQACEITNTGAMIEAKVFDSSRVDVRDMHACGHIAAFWGEFVVEGRMYACNANLSLFTSAVFLGSFVNDLRRGSQRLPS